jgi:hypothetical protein
MNQGTIAVNGDEVFKIVWVITVLAFMIERALAILFEHRLWIKLEDKWGIKGLKELVAIALAYNLCAWASFDALALMFHKESSWHSVLITALVVAGGSKGAVKLMQGYLGIKKAGNRRVS